MRSVSGGQLWLGSVAVSPIRELGAKAVIPPRANRKESREYDVYHYRSRNLIERFFARIKHFRRIATRYDKLAVCFEAFVSITAAFIWLA